MRTINLNYKITAVRFLTTTGVLAVLTSINLLLFEIIHYKALGMIYLMGITTASLYFKNYNIILATIMGAFCWNVLFIPPRFAFAISDPEDWALLVLYIVAGTVIGTFMKRLKEKESVLKEERNRATQLYSITKALSSAEDAHSLIQTIHSEIKNVFHCSSSLIVHHIPGQEYFPTKMKRVGDFSDLKDEDKILQQVVRKFRPMGRFCDDFPETKALYYPIIGEKKILGILILDLASYTLFTHDQWAILDSMARQLSTGLLRERLETELRGKLVDEESERIYKTLLNSVSHEMRTPLAAIKGFASTLFESEIIKDPEKIKACAEELTKGVERLDYVVQNLLDMSRLESGNLKLKLDYADVVETINTAVRKVKRHYGDKPVNVKVTGEIPLLFVDYFLIEQTFENIIRNSFLYTPVETPLDVLVEVDDHFVNINLRDYGPGIQGQNPQVVFKKFYRENPQKSGGVGLGLSICKSIVELHNGYLSVENVAPKGAAFLIKIPRELDREFQNL